MEFVALKSDFSFRGKVNGDNSCPGYSPDLPVQKRGVMAERYHAMG